MMSGNQPKRRKSARRNMETNREDDSVPLHSTSSHTNPVGLPWPQVTREEWEDDGRAGGEDDPREEEKDMPVPGLPHRYPDRCLMVVTNFCSMYCRHCTRKRIWALGEGAKTEFELTKMFSYIKRHEEIRDVIVSGGDPLTLPTDRIEFILKNLRKIPHVEIIRIGTPVPVVRPMRRGRALR